ncbi:MAG: PEP-CTERM sorting domain-containing protein [Candidatus Nanopelagicaceae bacterium]|nr:PEP-CTERM sorting domain-containing protein [Candidatus Nanopelagicaceae bacterium]
MKTIIKRKVMAAAVALAIGGGVATAQAGPLADSFSVWTGTSFQAGVTELDWSSAGSYVVKGAGPFGSPILPGQTFQALYQAQLTNLVGAGVPAGMDVVSTGAGAGVWDAGKTFEYTISAVLNLVAGPVFPPPFTPFGSAFFTLAPGINQVSIFYDTSTSGVAANTSLGTGFDSGVQVAHFTIDSELSNFTLTSPTTGSGFATLHGDLVAVADFVDSNYLKDGLLNGQALSITDIHFGSDQSFPALDSSTAGFHMDPGSIYPSYTVNAGTDLVLKADGHNKFSVPEPGTLLLFGAGLLAFVGLRGRNAQAMPTMA